MKILKNLNSLDFRDEIFYELAYYNGVLFSGIVKTEFEEIKFENGFTIHKVNFHKNGVKSSEVLYKQGLEIKSSSWFDDGLVESELTFDYLFFNEPGTVLTTGFSLYSNGKTKLKAENGIAKSYAKNGVLVLENNSTPKKKYFKEFYLNGKLKYFSLPDKNQSYHYSDTGEMIIEENLTYGKKYIKYNDRVIEANIRKLFENEGKEHGLSEQADNIRYRKLLTWLVNKIQNEDLSKYLKLNFELCFCKDEVRAKNAFKRIIKMSEKIEINDLDAIDIVGISEDEYLKKLENLKSEVSKK